MAHLMQEAEFSLVAGLYQQAVSKYLQAAIEWPSCRPKIKEQLLIAVSHVIDNLNLAGTPSHAAQDLRHYRRSYSHPRPVTLFSNIREYVFDVC
jgi:hypothetical protein